VLPLCNRPSLIYFDLTPIIKTLLKRFAQGLILLTVILLVLRLFFYDDLKRWVFTEVQAYLTELEYGDLQINNLELSVLSNFPSISVQLNKVKFYEKKDSIRLANTQPIFSAEQLNLAFSSWELIRHKNLVVTSLVSENGVLNILTYEDDTTNLERAFDTADEQNELALNQDKSNAEEGLISIALDDLYFNNFNISYTNPCENYTSQVKLETLSGKILLNEAGLSCDLNSSFEITESSGFPMISNLGPAELRLNLDFIEAAQEINIHDGTIRFETISVDINGSYTNTNDKYIDIKFDASANDLAFLSKLIKEDVLLQNSALIKKADIILKGQLKGKMEDNIPKIDVIFSVSDLSLIIPKSKGEFSNLGFEGELHTGEADDLSGGELVVRNLRGELPGGLMSGNFSVNNFKNPNLKSSMNLDLNLDGFDDILNLPNIDSLKGKLHFTSNIDGKINTEDQHALDDIGSWSLDLESIGFKYIPTNKNIDELHGSISEINNELALHDLSMRYDNSDISINGRIKTYITLSLAKNKISKRN
jgi:hypothetical protein